MSYVDFSSWPREQEQAFVVYEQRANESQKKAVMVAVIAAVGVLLLMLGIYAGVEPDRRDVTKGMNMSNLTKKSKQSKHEDAPAPAPAEKPAEKPAEPAAAPSDETPADKPAE